MELTTFLTTVFCLIDDWLAGQPHPLRQRGPQPTLADSEVLTIECVGGFLGIDTDSGLYHYFRRHWADWFPGLRRIHRTTFTRQAANLWAVKQRLHQHLLAQVGCDPGVSIVDSAAVPVCRFARAYRCRRLREVAGWGYDEVARQAYLGLRAHLRVCWPGVVADGRLAPATSRTWRWARSCWPGWRVGCWPTATTAARGWPPSPASRAGGCLPRPGEPGASGRRPGWWASAAGSRP
jgi:hypothetical protein